MNSPSSPSKWHGIIPPMITPLSDRDTLDVPGLERLLEHILAGGVHGLFLLGTTGEGPSLSYRLRRELVERVCRQVAGRMPVLVGITDTSFTESVALARFAAHSGASALVASAPYYYSLNQSELLEYVKHLASEMPLPLFLYNMPSHTKVAFSLETVRRAMEIPNIIGLKDSSGNMASYHHLIRLRGDRPDWTLLMGPEELLAESLLLGGDGGVCGGANLCPKLYVALYEAATSGDTARAVELHHQIITLAATLYNVGLYGSSFVKGLKCALSCLEICDDSLAEPFQRFDSNHRETIEQGLKTLNITAAAPWPHL